MAATTLPLLLLLLPFSFFAAREKEVALSPEPYTHAPLPAECQSSTHARWDVNPVFHEAGTQLHNVPCHAPFASNADPRPQSR